MKIFALFALTLVGFAVVLFLTMDATSVRALQPAPDVGPVADWAPMIRIVAAKPSQFEGGKERSVSEMAIDLGMTDVFAGVEKDHSSGRQEELLFEVEDAGTGWSAERP